MEKNLLSIGWASADISTEGPINLPGQFHMRISTGILDPITATALWISDGNDDVCFLSIDLVTCRGGLTDAIKEEVAKRNGDIPVEKILLNVTHTHTGPEFRRNLDETTIFALEETANAAFRAIRRAFMNLQESSLEVTSVYNNPYGFVRRYFMKSGDIVTNPGWCNPEVDKPECDFDRTIGILAVKQYGRIAALICNIANHGDTVGGDIVSADWYGHFVHQVQHDLKSSIPVLVLDDASGTINHFDFHQQINQTGYHEAVRIGRGYARIVLDALADLKPVAADKLQIKNTTVTIPHRQLSDEEVAAAQNILDTVPDIKKEGDFESQDLANKVPAALRYFAQRALDCKAKSTPSHECRLTTIEIGDKLAFFSLPGEPFNGIAEAIRSASPYEYTFIAELAQSPSGYVPMAECFARGGYEVQPGVDTVAPEAAQAIIDASVKNI